MSAGAFVEPARCPLSCSSICRCSVPAPPALGLRDQSHETPARADRVRRHLPRLLWRRIRQRPNMPASPAPAELLAEPTAVARCRARSEAAGTLGRIGHGNQVLTIHDMIARSYPGRKLVDRRFNELVLPGIVRRARAVFTVSEASRQALCNFYKLDPAKVSIIPNGIDLATWSPGESNGTRGGGYLLTVGANRPQPISCWTLSGRRNTDARSCHRRRGTGQDPRRSGRFEA